MSPRAHLRVAAGFAAAALFAVPGRGLAEKRKLSIEDTVAEPPLAGRPVSGVTWLAGGSQFSYVVRKGSGDAEVSELWVEETASGKKRMVVSIQALALPEEPTPEKTGRRESASLEGYRWSPSAPLTKAGEIRAPLLLIHGASDDNVHLQNTLAFVDALARARKPYELQIQPRQKHGFRGTDSLTFRNQAIVRFFEEHL